MSSQLSGKAQLHRMILIPQIQLCSNLLLCLPTVLESWSWKISQNLTVPGFGLGAKYLPGTGAGGVCFSLLLSSVSLPSETPVGREAGLGGQADALDCPRELCGGEALEWET